MLERETNIPPPEDIIRIEEVPPVTQKHNNWCGYASLSMVLQFHGYKDLTPRVLFEHLHGTYDERKENLDGWLRTPAPTLSNLALVTQELTSLRVDLWNEKKYKALKERKPEITPFDVLDSYILERKTPPIIRFPHHYKVAVGVRTDRTEYEFINPSHGGTQLIFNEKVDELWSYRESSHPDDTSYLMLTVHGQK